MATYQEKMAAFFGPLGQKAAEMILRKYSDLITLSLDEALVFERIVSEIRLDADELPMPASVEDILKIQERILAKLLRDGIVEIKTHGLSTAGKAQYAALLALVAPAEFSQPEVPAFDSLAEIVRDYQAMGVSQFKKSLFTNGEPNERFRLYEQACSEGRLG